MLEIMPVDKIDAVVRVPGSKSYTNRSLITASLAAGKSIIKNALLSEDTQHMISCLSKIGMSIKSIPEDGVLTVDGCGGEIPVNEAQLFAGNAGTVMRFMTATLTLGEGRYEIDGVERMRNRPIQELLDGLNQLGADVASKENTGCPPVLINASGLKGGIIKMKGDVSSQYISAILLAAPYAISDVHIVITDDLVSKNYVDMTIEVMNRFGVNVERDSYKEFHVSSGQCYKGCEYVVESDASSASYFLAAAAITGGKVRIDGLGENSLQGDASFVDVLNKMGCTIKKTNNWLEVVGGRLRGVDVDMNDTPDVVQTLAVVAVFAVGKTRIRNVRNLRYKETDRIAAIVNELKKTGVKVREYEDGLEIEPAFPHSAEISTYNDHRMAMSFALIGLRTKGIKIKNPECVYKTFPDFFERLEKLYHGYYM
ncbi:MAG: 3-phosphoshikimate 1-carboxyvinyltransferase [Candidatus Scalindua rubra]|uniref:3-phosphoshikimate 1-carboxyvinyltransferase n=1 Tax=Candidatus Scalindua rubra TaxID=1872076 RepID=A0A1E3XA48_9BACT|nr:MAG: 3-phosphoshikimate 1-carboxyvinyltransferase [Candidatus Scalindua rubra]